MSETIWKASAPSNIALIKYMGKTDASQNRPTNVSLSYTLPHLRTRLELELAKPSEDRWEPLTEFEGRKLSPIALSDKGRTRFLQHLARIKKVYDYSGAFVVRSANDFPSDCGLASSASSFAALTMAGIAACASLTGQPALGAVAAADLSRQGSGSSCRSFFAPWSIWDAEGCRDVSDLGHGSLLHQVVVVDSEMKSVSSSQAHVRVSSSLLFRGRPERAELRLRGLMAALKETNWREAFEISWAEFWDMHALFETAAPSFGYMTTGSLEVLKTVRAMSWDLGVEGPIVTMDAGPNVHLLYKPEMFDLARAIEAKLAARFGVISNADRTDV